MPNCRLPTEAEVAAAVATLAAHHDLTRQLDHIVDLFLEDACLLYEKPWYQAVLNVWAEAYGIEPRDGRANDSFWDGPDDDEGANRWNAFTLAEFAFMALALERTTGERRDALQQWRDEYGASCAEWVERGQHGR